MKDISLTAEPTELLKIYLVVKTRPYNSHSKPNIETFGFKSSF